MSTEVVVKKSYLQVILLAMGHFFNDFYCNLNKDFDKLITD